MSLEEYTRKRDFANTPEPRPAAVSRRKKGLSYLIQKHDATRLHYDFRLELDGVLLSWAVTKGPSLNPADKRLAVRTEDHPLSYGSFEGTIPKGQYGGGTVMLWDKGSWEPLGDPHAGLTKGHLSFVLHGERLKGSWDLVRMRTDNKRENWLLIKRSESEARQTGENKPSPRHNHAAAKPLDDLQRLMDRYPEVQLATLVSSPPQDAKWLHEIKLDGYRLLGFVSAETACLRTRNGKDWTAKFPTLVASLERLHAKDAVIDMEAVILDDKGRSSFQALQRALVSCPGDFVSADSA